MTTEARDVAQESLSSPGQSTVGSGELLAVAGLTARQLHYWTFKGWLRPRNPDPGKGRDLEWAPSEVRVAVVMAVLVVECEMSPGKAAEVARSGGQIASGVRLVIDRDDVCWP